MADSERKKFYITTPIYYVNDKPHIGTAYTTVAADCLARLHRQIGEDVFFQTGTDEHGAKIAQAAEKAGKSPKEFVDEISAKFSFAWDQLGIAPDKFIRTTDEEHKNAVKIFLEKLKASDKLYEGEYEGLYCVGHEAFIKESDLVNGLCSEHKTKPQHLKEKNWFFKLSEYQQILDEKISDGDFVIKPESRKNEVLSFIRSGLEDIAVSRPNVKWGIPLPWDPNQTVYVWVEALFN
jgi:methionyl-tRNA synthetase